MVDVSRNVVAGLLVLVIIVSGVSMYYALWAPQDQPYVAGPSGEVKLTILQPGQSAPEPTMASTGNVVLSIQKQEASP